MVQTSLWMTGWPQMTEEPLFLDKVVTFSKLVKEIHTERTPTTHLPVEVPTLAEDEVWPFGAVKGLIRSPPTIWLTTTAIEGHNTPYKRLINRTRVRNCLQCNSVIFCLGSHIAKSDHPKRYHEIAAHITPLTPKHTLHNINIWRLRTQRQKFQIEWNIRTKGFSMTQEEGTFCSSYGE